MPDTQDRGGFVPPFKTFTIDEEKEVKVIQAQNIIVPGKAGSKHKNDKKLLGKYQ